jgi:hypothetical protein
MPDAKLWFKDDSELNKWVEVMDLRIRYMCRDAQQGKTKNPDASWVKQIFGGDRDDDPEGEGEEGEEEEEGEEDEEEDASEEGDRGAGVGVCTEKEFENPAVEVPWFVGYDSEMEQPWRSKSDKAKHFREYTSKLVLPADAADGCAGMVAVWDDGFSHQIPDITVDEWKAKQTSRRGQALLKAADACAGPASSAGVCTFGKAAKGSRQKWEGLDKSSGNKVTVTTRSDKLKADGTRRELCSLFVHRSGKYNNQICQVALDKFDEKQHDEIFKVMGILGEEFCNGITTTKDALLARRDALLKDHGVLETPMKRPAAAAAASSGSQEVVEPPGHIKQMPDSAKDQPVKAEEPVVPATPPGKRQRVCGASSAVAADDSSESGPEAGLDEQAFAFLWRVRG